MVVTSKTFPGLYRGSSLPLSTNHQHVHLPTGPSVLSPHLWSLFLGGPSRMKSVGVFWPINDQ